jgi:hypothetical protein
VGYTEQATRTDRVGGPHGTREARGSGVDARMMNYVSLYCGLHPCEGYQQVVKREMVGDTTETNHLALMYTGINLCNRGYKIP